IELPYNPAIALLGIYPKDTKILIRRGTCTLMFIAVLSTIAKLWKEPKCPLTYEWIKKMWGVYIYTYTCNRILLRDEILPFATTWMELEGSHSENDRCHMISLICGI
ncbi:LORF2 protein, partial [Crocuta crocuta]